MHEKKEHSCGGYKIECLALVARSIWRQAGTGGGEFVWLEAGILLGSEQVEPSEDPVLLICVPLGAGWDRRARICLCLFVSLLGWSGGSVSRINTKWVGSLPFCSSNGYRSGNFQNM